MGEERRRARALDEEIGRDGSADPLAGVADKVRGALATDVPPADRQRALFLSGIAGRRRRGFSTWRLAVPATGLAALLAFVFVAGQSALPGDRLYPVRKAFNSVGLGRSALEEARTNIDEATRLVHAGEASIAINPGRALRLAVAALEEIGVARHIIDALDERHVAEDESLEGLEDRAVAIISDTLEPSESEDENGSDGSGEDDSGSDDSGHSRSDDSGSGDSGSPDSGSGDSGSGDSGSGDSGSGDSGSGHSGSSDSGSGDSGSGDSGSADSGSGDSGSGD